MVQERERGVVFRVPESERDAGHLIAHTVFVKTFCKCQFPHKSVNLLFILVIIKDKSTNLSGD